MSNLEQEKDELYAEIARLRKYTEGLYHIQSRLLRNLKRNAHFKSRDDLIVYTEMAEDLETIHDRADKA